MRGLTVQGMYGLFVVWHIFFEHRLQRVSSGFLCIKHFNGHIKKFSYNEDEQRTVSLQIKQKAKFGTKIINRE